MIEPPSVEPPLLPPAEGPPAATGWSPRRRKAAVGFILVTLVLDMVALGIIIPVLPRLIEDFVGSPSAAGIWVGVFATLWAAAQFVSTPIQGALSDRFGRRPVILASNAGLGLDYVFMALAPSLGWLLVGRVISGITAASVSTAFAYITDVTTPERRAAAFGILGAAFGLGFIMGPLLGGVLGHIDPRLPFWAAAGLSLANALYGFFVLPESLPKAHRDAFSWRKANPVGSLGLLRSHPEVLGLATVNFLEYFAHYALQTVFVLYAGHRYGWDTQTIGFSLAGIGVCTALVQGGVTGWVVKRIGERATVIVGLTCGVLGFTIYGLAPTGAIFLLGIPITALWGMAGPAAKSLMSQRVQAHEQGKLQGAVASLASTAGLVAPLVFGELYALFNGPLTWVGQPGMPWLVGAFILALATLLAWRVARGQEARDAAAAG